MAKFQLELPNELIKELEQLEQATPKMMGEMTQAGAEVVYRNVLKNMKRSFKDTKRLEPHLRITKVYRTYSDDAINTKVGFYGYLAGTEGKVTKYTKVTNYKKGKRKGTSSVKTYSHNYGVPVPLVVIAREYGTRSGEKKKPFFRRAFRKSEIESEMLKVQDKYIPKD